LNKIKIDPSKPDNHKGKPGDFDGHGSEKRLSTVEEDTCKVESEASRSAEDENPVPAASAKQTSDPGLNFVSSPR
jgi:hypothetical protein